MAKRQKTASRGKSLRKNSKPTIWPWISTLLLAILFVTAIGISTSKPSGKGWMLTLILWAARRIASIAGDLTMYLCFLIILTSLIKIVKPGDAVPRSVKGLWFILLTGSAFWHRIKVPWDNTFVMAKMGTGGGLVGASLYWFARILFGHFGALVAIVVGFWSGLCMVMDKSGYTPFRLLWLLWLTLWRNVENFFKQLFKAQGPAEEDIEYEALAPHGLHQNNMIDNGSLEKAEESSFVTTVSQIQKQLAKSDTVQNEPVERAPTEMKILSTDGEIAYQIPSLDILEKSHPKKRLSDSRLHDGKARTIEKTLLSFGVAAKVIHITSGPAATRFELQPGPGVKISSIVNLSQDIALALAAHDVRIEAPIPGKSAVGIEVPNQDISVVRIRDIFESKEFRNSSSALTVALGIDISGKPVVTSLDRCVHLLIAGATGTGKSVCINSIITSILFKSSPDQAKLLLIDPKRVELSTWSKIPHLIAPVATDPKKASSALRWTIKEMESRYEKFTKVGTRDIERYNEIATPPGSHKPALPYIVVIIDELSDLMVVSPAEVEDSIFRLAQMARAAGIHLVVATQRPSVDVITGTIKANISSRIAFAVSSQTDSRTILDMGGAEKLLGRGDMLFFPVGATRPLRAQGSYVSEREIDELVSFVSSQAEPQFAQGVLSVPDPTPEIPKMQDDPLFPQALRLVIEAKQASVSLLQRRLPIGYSRAARLIDAMELKGYIGPYEGSKPREVRISMAEYLRKIENPDGDFEEPQDENTKELPADKMAK